MGRPPSNGGPSFRFNQAEVTEMEAILQAHHTAMPAREVLMSLADKFSSTSERSGKIKVHMKQVWNWFQNRRYAIRAKAAKAPGKLLVSPMPRDNSAILRNGPQVPSQQPSNPSAPVAPMPLAPQHPPASSVPTAGRIASENTPMEFEAKSARDGAWYDVSTFLSHRSLETGDPEVLVRFSGFGPEEDEWVNIRKHVRQRSLPCESSECVAVLPGDLILCFQEGKEQALYFDAHVLDAQRRRHDVRGCRCRFLVRYDHDQSEEIVALRKICRRPETDYRLQQLHALNESAALNQNKTGANIHMGSTLRVYPPVEVMPKPLKVEAAVTAPQPSLPVSTETKLQHKVEAVVLPPRNNLPQVSESAAQQKVAPTVSAPSHGNLPGVSEAKTQQGIVVVPAPSHGNLPDVSEAKPQQRVEVVVPAPSHGNLPDVSEAKPQQRVEVVVPAPSHGNMPDVSEPKPQQKVEAVVPAPSHGNLPEVSEAKAQQKVEAVVPAPSHSNLPEVSEAKTQQKVEPAVAAPSHSNPEILEGAAQQKVEHVVPTPTPTGVPEASKGKVDQKVEPQLPKPSSTNVADATDTEVQNKVEPVIPAPANVTEAAEVTLDQDVEMVNADKEPNSDVPVDNTTEMNVTATTVSDQDQEMQEAS